MPGEFVCDFAGGGGGGGQLCCFLPGCVSITSKEIGPFCGLFDSSE